MGIGHRPIACGHRPYPRPYVASSKASSIDDSDVIKKWRLTAVERRIECFVLSSSPSVV